MNFDDNYFIPRAEGNLNLPNGSFLRRPYPALGRDRTNITGPFIPPTSILTSDKSPQRMQTVSCPTLNSFAAFSDSYMDPVTGSTTNVASPDTGQPWNPNATTSGNSTIDFISGIIHDLTPAAVAAVNRTNNPSAAALMQQYLQGRLPGYHIDPATGKLVKDSSSLVPLLAIGGLAVLVVVLMAKR